MNEEQLAPTYTCKKRTAGTFMELKKCSHMCTNKIQMFTMYITECQLINQQICRGKFNISSYITVMLKDLKEVICLTNTLITNYSHCALPWRSYCINDFGFLFFFLIIIFYSKFYVRLNLCSKSLKYSHVDIHKLYVNFLNLAHMHQ